MNRTYLAVGLALALLVVGASASYTVGEAEQVIITQFGNPVGAPIVGPGPALQAAIRPADQLLRQALPRMGRQSEPGSDERQAVHLGRHLRPVAHCRSAALLPATPR